MTDFNVKGEFVKNIPEASLLPSLLRINVQNVQTNMTRTNSFAFNDDFYS